MEDSDSGMSSHDDSESGLPPGFKPDLSKVRAELAFEGTGGGPLVFNDHGNLGVSSTPTVFSRASSLRQQLSFESIVGVMEVDGSRPSRTQSLPTGKIYPHDLWKWYLQYFDEEGTKVAIQSQLYPEYYLMAFPEDVKPGRHPKIPVRGEKPENGTDDDRTWWRPWVRNGYIYLQFYGESYQYPKPFDRSPDNSKSLFFVIELGQPCVFYLANPRKAGIYGRFKWI